MFQDMAALRKEELETSGDTTQEYYLDMDTTAENSDILDPTALNHCGVKRRTDGEELDEQNPAKVQKTDAVAKEVINIDTTDHGKEVTLKKADEPDAFEESLICIICQEILHDCISCQPCMHSFCAGCYSDWMGRSTECPSCRGTVERVNKNYVINNLVDAYLKEHPEKKRPEDELKALDARSKVSKNSMKPPPPKRTISDLIDAEDEDEEDDDDEENDELSCSDGDENPIPMGFGGTSAFGTVTFQNVYRPPKTVCRQCPEHKAPGAAFLPPGITALAAAAGSVISKAVNLVKGNTADTAHPDGDDAGPSTRTDAIDDPTLDTVPYKCTPAQVHILCQCCLKPMPDRRTAAHTDKTIKPQQCMLCYRLYCHAYWGCEEIRCDGCLAKFKDLNFTAKIWPNLILDNNYESDIFKNYIESKGLNINDVVKVCLTKLDEGTYTCMDQARGLTSNSMLCYACGLRNLRDLTYQYRKDIPNDQLPVAVTNRSDCYWGSNCRTQRGKIHHAAKFNHVCKQSRT